MSTIMCYSQTLAPKTGSHAFACFMVDSLKLICLFVFDLPGIENICSCLKTYELVFEGEIQCSNSCRYFFVQSNLQNPMCILEINNPNSNPRCVSNTYLNFGMSAVAYIQRALSTHYAS